MGTVAAISKTNLSVESLLGGRRVLQARPRSPLDWVSVIRRGISSAAVDSLTKSIRVTQSELATVLGIAERTLARRKKEGVLNSEESAKLVRLARVVERAKDVFEDFEASLNWLKSPNAALSGATPLSLLDTDIGAESVLDTLGRIEHGVFA
jgi:putative toxin-antitoxin system antitoxin component (TIGR02293 family)